MVDRVGAEADQEVLYDVHLARRPPDVPAVPVPLHDGPQHRERRPRCGSGSSEPQQLDDLLEKVFSVGLVLTDVHRLTSDEADRAAGLATYEVRVAGELGRAACCGTCGGSTTRSPSRRWYA